MRRYTRRFLAFGQCAMRPFRWVFRRFRWSLSFLGISSLLWLLLRSGARPTRVVYPCQRIAAANVNAWLGVSFVVFVARMRKSLGRLLVPSRLLPIGLAAAGIGVLGFVAAKSSDWVEEARFRKLREAAAEASERLSPSSSVFVVEKGGDSEGLRHLGVDRLIDLMGVHGLCFYRTEKTGVACSPTGLISSDDVIVIKVNCQWAERGGTNTDVLKGLIYRITQHPDGFTGEVVVADNGQDVGIGGSLDWANSNAEDHGQSAQDVVNLFSGSYKVSTYLWTPLRNRAVAEFDQNDMTDGYVLAATPDPQTNFRVSYPKFTTVYGTRISFKRGVYQVYKDSAFYNAERLKVINVPVLKTHSGFGMTACIKHYIGLQSQPLSNGHNRLSQGAMGTLFADVGLPVVNILDAIYINANPKGTSGNGPGTSYSRATRLDILMASTDPIALDAWAARNVMIPTMSSLGYTNPNLGDFWNYLGKSEDVLLLAGHPVTSDDKLTTAYRADGERPVLTDMKVDESGRVTLDWLEIAPGSFAYRVEESAKPEGPWMPAPGTDWPILATQWTSGDGDAAKSCFYRVRRDPAAGE